MFSIANCKMEPKETAFKGSKYAVKFQGRYLRPCIGLVYWIRWGEFIFDIRPVWEYLKMPELSIAQMSYPNFVLRMEELISAVGCNSFFRLNADVNEIIQKRNSKIIETNRANGIDDDLPF